MYSKRTVLATTKITRGYQITLTKDVRDKFEFNVGDILVLVEKDGKLFIEKA